MNINQKNVAASIALTATLILSACSDGGSGGLATATPSEQNSTPAGQSNVIVASDFAFPDVDANGAITPVGPAPEFSARRTLSAGTGSTIEFGDPVVLDYDMYSWNTGALIESTDDFDEPYTIRAGLTDGVPEYLSKSLLGRKVGDEMQIIFEQGMEDLPGYLDSEDAYILVLSLR